MCQTQATRDLLIGCGQPSTLYLLFRGFRIRTRPRTIPSREFKYAQRIGYRVRRQKMPPSSVAESSWASLEPLSSAVSRSSSISYGTEDTESEPSLRERRRPPILAGLSLDRSAQARS